MSEPHYVATCPNDGSELTVTRERVATGRPVFCQTCCREMPVVNIGGRPVKPKPPREVE